LLVQSQMFKKCLGTSNGREMSIRYRQLEPHIGQHRILRYPPRVPVLVSEREPVLGVRMSQVGNTA
jgi:hypothetical protein